MFLPNLIVSFPGKFRKEFRLAVKICVGCGMSESVRQSEMLRMTLYSGRSMIYRYNSNRRSQACRTEEAAMETVHLQDKNISVY